MKKIDIDQLKKENIYTTPENAFSEMQSRVFSNMHKLKEPQTPAQKEKIIPLFWKYAVAASVVFIFGLGLFTLNFSKNEEKIINNNENPQLISQKEIKKEETPTYTPKVVNNEKPETSVAKIEKTTTENQPKILSEKPKTTPQNIATKTQNIKTENVDDVLDMYSSSELAMLTKEAEQDVYLDVFNY